MTQTWTNEKDGSPMRLIPAGEFIMGSTREQTEDAKRMDKAGPQFPLLHETPQFRANTENFYVSVFAVTNEQFARFVSEARPSAQHLQHWISWLDRIIVAPNESEPYRASPKFKTHPVINVTWFGVEAYCQWAGLRLPTEIEWEKAARGSYGRIFPWGNEWTPIACAGGAAARVRLPLCARKRAKRSAHERFTTRAPNPTNVSGTAAGGTGSRNFCQAVQTVLRPGISRITPSAIPKRARLVALQPSATAITRLIEVSSRKSTLSARSETEPITIATPNSTPK